jgi:hypothetical protein
MIREFEGRDMVFKLDHLFAGGNGSVPSIGGTSLAAALVGVEQAERALAAARALAQAAAKRERVSVRGLFEDSRFILRASGEKWVEQARGEPAARLGEAILRAFSDDGERRSTKPGRLSAWRAKLADTGFFAAIEAGDFEAAAATCAKGSKAGAIIAAGKKARMSVSPDEVPEPPKGSLAAQIIRAGQRRRGEV